MANKNLQKLELTWIGKGEEPKLEPRILLENPEYSYGDPNAENILIHGDNLLALKALEQNYTGKVKCIYIDPPYNTGHAFEHYDDFQQHSIWLNLMHRRIKILYKLLDGEKGSSFWIHLDDSEIHYCKVICDEIFGRENFISHITYERSGVGGIGQGGTFIKTGEGILVYKKGNMIFNEVNNFLPMELSTMKRYNKFIKSFGEKELIEEFISRSNGENVRVFKHIDYVIETVSFKNYDKKQVEIDSEYASHYGSLFRSFLIQKENSFQQDIISRMEKNSLYSVEYIPSRGKNKGELTNLYYTNKELVGWLKDTSILEKNRIVKSSKLTNIWAHKDIPKADLPNEGGVSFPRGKKPEQLLKRIFDLSTSEGDIVLDSFAGSGSTAAVALKMNRKFITIELENQAVTHCLPRFKNIISNKDNAGISKSVNWQGGSGFKFYSLAPSLLKKDKFGKWVISEDYNPDMLAAAMSKQEGFKYQPHDSVFWKQGYSTEQDFIFTTTQFLTVQQLEAIADGMQPEESLLICCKAFQQECQNKFKNITIKKIPLLLLERCEFGRDDYSLNIINIPFEQPYIEEDDDFSEEDDTLEDNNTNDSSNNKKTLFD